MIYNNVQVFPSSSHPFILKSLPSYISHHLLIHPSVHQYFIPSNCLPCIIPTAHSIYLTIHSILSSIILVHPLHPLIHPSVLPFVYLVYHRSFLPSIQASTHLSILLSTHSFIYSSVTPSPTPSSSQTGDITHLGRWWQEG